MMHQAAWERNFFGAARRAFLGDGLAANWTIHRQHFSTFLPILDFVHALSYVFAAAFAGRSPGGLRDEAEMAMLPEAKRADCRKLWGDVEASLRRAEGEGDRYHDTSAAGRRAGITLDSSENF